MSLPRVKAALLCWGLSLLAQAEQWKRTRVLVGHPGHVGVAVVCREVGIMLWKPERGRSIPSCVAGPCQQQIPGPHWDLIDWK